MSAIFRDYDAAALEQQYLPQRWLTPEFQQGTIDRWVEMGRAFHRRANVKANIAYGNSPRQSIDVLVPAVADAPILASYMAAIGEIGNSTSNRTASASSRSSRRALLLR